jgi:hypothetical protein
VGQRDAEVDREDPAVGPSFGEVRHRSQGWGSGDAGDLLAFVVDEAHLELVVLAEVVVGEGDAGEESEVGDGGDFGTVDGVDPGRDDVGEATFRPDVVAEQGVVELEHRGPLGACGCGWGCGGRTGR